MTTPESASRWHEYTLEGLAHDGRAVLRTGDGVHLVSGFVPGEKVRVRSQSAAKKNKTARATLPQIELLERSEFRRDPVCPVQSECGGCPTMHMDPSFAFYEKIRSAKSHLRKVLDNVVESSFAADAPLGYRTRARLLFSDHRLGYREAQGHKLTELDAELSCAILDPRLARAVAVLRAQWISHVVGRGEVLLLTSKDKRAVLSIRCETMQSAAFYQATEKLIGTAIAGARVVLAGTATAFGGASEWFPDPERVLLRAGADGFYQGNDEINRKLGEFVLLELGDVQGKTIFDLYAGAGNFTLPLLRRGANVVAVESATTSTNALTDNVGAEKLAAKLTLVATTSEAFAATLTRQSKPHAVILDPPRAGAKSVLPLLFGRNPERVIYVSCDVATLARDLESALVGQTRYRFSKLGFFDMFPQTAHIECVAVIERT